MDIEYSIRFQIVLLLLKYCYRYMVELIGLFVSFDVKCGQELVGRFK